MKIRASMRLFFLLAAVAQQCLAPGLPAKAAFLEHYPAFLQAGAPAALRTGSPAPSSEAPSGATAVNGCPLASGEGYQNGAGRFVLSNKIYKPNDNVQAAIKAEYGENANIWTELKSILRSQQERLQVHSRAGITPSEHKSGMRQLLRIGGKRTSNRWNEIIRGTA